MNNLTATTTRPVVQPRDEATIQGVLGGSVTVRLRSEATGGQLGLVEQVVPGGYPGPALHAHPDFDETFYVTGGSLVFRVGEEAYEAGPGTVAFIPRGTAHTFANPWGAPARMLVLVSPGGLSSISSG